MSDRILGTIAMICAPVLLIEELLRQGQENALITGVAKNGLHGRLDLLQHGHAA